MAITIRLYGSTLREGPATGKAGEKRFQFLTPEFLAAVLQ